jgi:hypothetical protein
MSKHTNNCMVFSCSCVKLSDSPLKKNRDSAEAVRPRTIATVTKHLNRAPVSGTGQAYQVRHDILNMLYCGLEKGNSVTLSVIFTLFVLIDIFS